MSNKILVVDDEISICDLIRVNLESEGYRVAVSQDGLDAIEKFKSFKPNLVVLDLMLPYLNGYEVCKKITLENPVPIIMLTAKSDLVDKVLGLELGADDYMTKPFHMRELTARIKALLRRTSIITDTSSTEILKNGAVEIIPESRKVTINGEPVNLSAKEFDLLFFFLKNMGKVFTRESLLEKVWGYEYAGDTRTVDVHIQRLRKKIKDQHPESNEIQTVFGVGYKMVESA